MSSAYVPYMTSGNVTQKFSLQVGADMWTVLDVKTDLFMVPSIGSPSRWGSYDFENSFQCQLERILRLFFFTHISSFKMFPCEAHERSVYLAALENLKRHLFIMTAEEGKEETV